MILTHREIQVVRLVARGMTNRKIADALGITNYMVREHVQSAFNKNDIHSRVRLAIVYRDTAALELLREVFTKLNTDRAHLKIGVTDEWLQKCESVINLGNGD